MTLETSPHLALPVDTMRTSSRFLLHVTGLVVFALLVGRLLVFANASLLGWYLRRKTQSRKRLVLARVEADERELQRTSPRADDGEWEKVEGYSATVADDAGQDWKGVVGFFHPFW